MLQKKKSNDLAHIRAVESPEYITLANGVVIAVENIPFARIIDDLEKTKIELNFPRAFETLWHFNGKRVISDYGYFSIST